MVFFSSPPLSVSRLAGALPFEALMALGVPALPGRRRADSVDRGQILRSKAPPVGADVLLELGDGAGTRDDGADERLSDQPGGGELGHSVTVGRGKGVKLAEPIEVGIGERLVTWR